MKQVVVIPARYASKRLPGKALIEISGIPMIVRTWRQCAKAVDPESIWVATDDERIQSVCEAEGIQTHITESECMTGTDRVAEFAGVVEADVYINVQGDEPLFNPADLKLLMENAAASPGVIINGYCPIETEENFRSPSIPKVVLRPDGRLLYMSRAAIPTTKALEFDNAYRQVCAYAFPAKVLHLFAEMKQKTPLENIEDIEILRFLEMGLEVRMVPMSSESIAVDMPDDVALVEAAIKRQASKRQ